MPSRLNARTINKRGVTEGGADGALVSALVSGSVGETRPTKVTDELVRSECAPERGSKTLWDKGHKDAITGFGVRIFAPTSRHPKGARSFFLNYRIGGVERRYTIGNYPDWSVAAARDKAKELRRQVDNGEDPTSEQREQREAPIMKDLKDRYVDDHLPTKAANEDKARRNDELAMLDLICDALGRHTKVAAVHHGDIVAMHKSITLDRGPIRANRTLAIASKAFSLALLPRAGEHRPWRDAAMGNPCKGVKRNPEEGKERFFSEAELAALSDALALDSTGSAADCVRLIMVTGCRPREAMCARWKEFDDEPGYWVKPSAHTKQRRTHKAPLNPVALELLATLRTKRDRAESEDKLDRPWVFPGQNRPGAPLKQIWSVWYAARERATVALWGQSSDERIANLVSALRAMLGAEMLAREPTIEECQQEAERRELKLPTGLLDARPYDLRHTFASVGAGGGLSLPIIGRVLGHTQARTTQRYAHLADDPLKEATARIGAVIGGAGRAGARVVSIKG
jgi:integrase